MSLEEKNRNYILLSQNIFKRKQTLTVVSRLDEPFLMQSQIVRCQDQEHCNDFTMPCRLPNRNATRGEATWVQANCYGYVVDLLRELSRHMRLDFALYVVQDGEFGRSLNHSTNQWNGMIGDVMKGSAAIALQGLTISEERLREVDFTVPYLESRVEILTLKEMARDELFSLYFLQMYEHEALYVLMGVFIFSILSIYITENLIIFHSNSTKRGKEEKRERLHLRDITLYVAASVFQKGDLGARNPRTYSGRVTALGWAFGFLVLTSLYTALLTADRVVTGGYTTFYGMEDKRVRSNSWLNYYLHSCL